MSKQTEIRLGQLLVQRNWCALSKVNQALAAQNKLRDRSESKLLGEILLEIGALDEETLRVALAEMGVLRLHCPVCRLDFPVASYEKGAKHDCQKCSSPLVLARDKTDGMSEESRRLQAQKSEPAPAGPAAEPTEADASAQKDAYLGRVLGGCQILEKVAHGGMGVVYKAKQLNLGRTVAVKILSKELSHDDSFVRRFIQEARSAAQLSHGNIVHINDVGEYQGLFYFVMEFVDGATLKEVMQAEKKIEVGRAIEIAQQVCHALRHAHGRGIIHRDIKPENIMITRDGVVKLADLGLAKRMHAEGTSNLTHAGSILGTPYYMAPEQAKDFSKVDHRSDIYSLGVTLYRMLTGKVPFEGRSPIEVMIKAIEGKKQPIHELRPEVPAEVEVIVDKMMHKSPQERYQDVAELIRDLNRILTPVV